MCKYLKKHLLSSAVFACIASGQTFAQEDTFSIEELVITAEKRAESLQDVSVAVSAITGDNLRIQGITGVEDLANLAPSLQFSEDNGNVIVALRGIVTTNTVESGDSATAFHVDGVYYSRPSSLTGTFYDIERIEVLRGPQGTLYGRNANAGNINIITNKPKDEFDAEIEIGFGDYSEKSFYGMLNLPISDTLAARFAVNYLENDGYIEQAFTENNGRADDIALRGHLLWEPTDNTSLLLSADYWNTKGAPARQVPVSTGDISTGEPVLEGFETTQSDYDNELWGLSAELNHDFDGFSLTSITAYRENNRYYLFDNDARVDENNVDTEQQLYLTDNTQEQFSQELRLASNGDGDLEWLVGAYFLDEKQNIFASFGSLIFPGLGLSFPQPDTNARSWSVFGQSTYNFSDSLRFIGGIRYSDEEKDRTGGAYLARGIDPRDPEYSAAAEQDLLSENIADVSWSKTTWKLGTEWDIANDSMVYLTVGTGFKAGGYFDGVQSEETSVSYDPEEILAWALGTKNQFFNNRVQLNVEAFIYDYEGYQVSFVDPIPPFGGARGTVTYNAKEADVSGIEAELVYLVSEGGQLSASLGLLDTEFSDFFITRNVDLTDPNAVPAQEDASGNSLPIAPDVTANLAYSHTWTLPTGHQLIGRVAANYQDEYYLNYDNADNELVDSYIKTDISLALKPADDGWYVNAFVNNVADELSCTRAGGTDGYCFSNKPRVWGVKAGMNF